jgi:O-antigen/teichoic acid export membrane protein
LTDRIRGVVLLGRGMSLTITDASTRGATVIVSLLIARYYGPTEYGYYAVASALAGLALIPTGLGFEQELTRRASIDRARLGQAMRLVLVAILIGAAIGTSALAGVLAIGPYSGQIVLYTGLLWIVLLFARLQLPFRHYALVLGRPEQSALVQGVGAAVIIAATVVLILAQRALWEIIVASLVIQAAIVLVWWNIVPKPHLHGEWRAPDLRRFLQASLPFGISNVIWSIYFNIDSVILALLRDAETVGIYGAAFRIVAVTFTLAYAVTSVFTPLLFSAFDRTAPEFLHHVKRMLVFLLLLGAGVGGSLFLFAGPIVELILGSAYSDAVLVMRVLSVAAMIRCVNYGLSEVLTTSRRQRMRLRLEGAMLAANVAANIALVPSLGALGAALAFVIGEVLLLGGVLWVLGRQGIIAAPARAGG